MISIDPTKNTERENYNEGRIDPRKLKAISRLAGSNYAKIGDIFALERPQ
ncbi:hypothetical protein [Lysinibacillus sp. FJAT-14745]